VYPDKCRFVNVNMTTMIMMMLIDARPKYCGTVICPSVSTLQHNPVFDCSLLRINNLMRVSPKILMLIILVV